MINQSPCIRKKVEISRPRMPSEATTIILKRQVAELLGFSTIVPVPVSGLISE